MFPTCHSSLWARCALSLDRTLLTEGTPIAMEFQATLDRTVAPNQTLISRTPVFVDLGIVNKIGLAEASICRGF